MTEQYDGWMHASRRSAAVCNDSHAPAAFFPKYWTKARNGFRHSFCFSTGNFPEPIRITTRNRQVTEGACRNCHGDIVAARAAGADEKTPDEARDFQRKAPFLLDFVEAQNSTGFHAPQEATRLLGVSLDYARKGQNALH